MIEIVPITTQLKSQAKTHSYLNLDLTKIIKL